MDTQQSTQAILGTVTPFPVIAPGHHLAPVGIGAPGPHQKLVFIECPDWCTTNHVAEWVHFIEDTNHTGDEFSIHIPSFVNEGKPVHTMSVAVGCDAMSTDSRMREAHVIVGDEGSVDAYLTPDMADKVAADLRKLAAKIEESARTARLHNQHEVVSA